MEGRGGVWTDAILIFILSFSFFAIFLPKPYRMHETSRTGQVEAQKAVSLATGAI